MKFISKINRGLILLVAVVVGIAIYLITLSAGQTREKPLINEVCRKYINTAANYRKLPQEYLKDKLIISETELNKVIEAMNNEIKTFYTNNEESYKYVLVRNKEELKKQAKGIGVIYKYEKEIVDFKSIVFNGNTVTVNLLTNTVMDRLNPYIPGGEREHISSQTTDTITLKKVQGKWKIVYADLLDPVPVNTGESANY